MHLIVYISKILEKTENIEAILSDIVESAKQNN